MRRLVLVAILAACSPPPVKTVEEPPPVAPKGSAAPASDGMISDDECRTRGGHIEDEHTYDYEGRREPGLKPTPYRVCRIPAASNGKSCSSSSECNGNCRCTGALARPDPSDDPALLKLDHTPGTGECSDGHLPPGAWFCLVENGKIQLAGIIID